MEKYLQPGDKVIDVGCGTGILSVLAAKLDAENIKAVDLDPEAVRSTENNIRVNHCEGKVDVYLGDLLTDYDFTADAVVANLTAEIQIRLLDAGLTEHCCGRGLFIASGIIDIKEKEALAAIEAKGFEILEILRDGYWTAVAARLKG